MGVSSSRIEEDKALQLCRERKRFVRHALNGRCSLAAAHVTYIESLKNTGTALRKFIEPDAPIESSLYSSTTATPEPLASTDNQFSNFSLSPSQHVDASETLSPSLSPTNSGRFQANYMKTGGRSSKTVEDRPPSPVIRTLRSSLSTNQNLTPQSAERPEASSFEDPPLPPGTPPWDYFFGHLHPIDKQISFQDGRGLNFGLENAEHMRLLREEEGILELEDEEEQDALTLKEESQESEDEFDEPSTDNLVQIFENRNSVLDSYSARSPSSMPSEKSIASEIEVLNGVKSNSPDLTPLKTTPSVATLPTDIKKTEVKESAIGDRLAPKDFLSSIKEIEYFFLKASESGKEVPRMLEANKLHFRPIFPGKEAGGSWASIFFKACFSCGEDPTHVPEEPAPTTIKYLTWHRTASSRSSSSRNLLGSNLKDDIQDISNNLFENFCMNSGSHASTLDRLFAWERKLYDEVKASGIIRREYDMKCKLLRQQDSRGESSHHIDKTRAIIKDLHSRIKVAIHRIDSISKRIEELRDKELQPQLEELIEGLRRMWEMMFECHNSQLNIISITFNDWNAKISIQSESHRQATIHLEYELNSLSSSLTKWISAQKFYVRAINGWLYKCIPIQQKSSRRKGRAPAPLLRDLGPPIFVTCGVWLESLEALPTKEVVDSIKILAADTTRFLPHQEKHQRKSLNQPFSSSWKAGSTSEATASTLRDEALQDWISGSNHFRLGLVDFLNQLNCFAESSLKIYGELVKAIQEAKSGYDQNT